MREQRGYVFHRGKSWFTRYCDDVLQKDGTIKRKLVCKKLPVPYGDQYRTKASVRLFVEDLLRPVNSGVLNPQSTMPVAEFVEKFYFPHVEKHLRASTLKGYHDMWEDHLKGRVGKVALRDFRTVHGETLLAVIAAQAKLSRNTLKHIKSFLSGVFKQAKRLGIIDGINPMQDVSTPRAPEAEETYAYSLDEVKKMLLVLEEPAKTVVLTAALSGLRKSELRGLQWRDFNGNELSVNRSVWNNEINEPKTRRSKAPVPVVKKLAEALNEHREKMGKLASPDLPIFQAGNGKPLNLDNLVRRAIMPALQICSVCRQSKLEHKSKGHDFQLDEKLPQWQGWHGFRRGLATTLHQLGVDDKTIQAILRHSNVGLTMNIYVKAVAESQVSAMDAVGTEFQNGVVCNDLATTTPRRIQ
jgi:integrase